MKTLKTTKEVIDALGGTEAVSAAFTASRQSVSNWRVHNSFPAHTYFGFSILLAENGIHADSKLWKMHRKPNTSRKKK